ncbi:MAG: response regulator [Xanthomonadales bacterium]|nr:response regulator [Gammaproteobacteria bacterium]MBT8055439.1 response regulator [Gammaproteobacteria bacterium]NNJ79996.1 response regulator [Xanthomonadales bacterium]NNL04843.1 response regulator [Xanthomonadales bacterium]
MIRLLVVDDHELVRIGLRHILADYPSIIIAGEAGEGEVALRMNRHLKPDVVLLDVCLPGLSGFEVTRRLKQASPRVGVIILTVHERAPYPERLLEAGASAYLTKGCAATELIQAIETVARGGRHIGSGIAQKMALNVLPGRQRSPFDGLSSREMEVLLMLTDGKKVADIAQTMHLSPKTVATYKYRIYEKLNTRNDVDMTRMAMRYGIVAPA